MYKKFPYPDNFFDAAFCFQAIYHGNLEQITFTLKEMKRVTKKGGYVFVNFLPYGVLYYDNKSKGFYQLSIIKNKMIGRNYLNQDKKQKHLFYPTGVLEKGVPHYYFTKNELRSLLKKIFKRVILKKVQRKQDVKWFYWLAYCKI
jgi:ubiquinone/menaquinone biosynthesis C-methylase UbiE